MRRRKSNFARNVRILLLVGLVVLMARYSLAVVKDGVTYSFPTVSFAQTLIPPDPAMSEEVLLLLVNKDNRLPEGYRADLTVVEGAKVDRIMSQGLTEMKRAAERDGVQLYITSAYRTKGEQKQIFNDTVSGYVKQGNSKKAAQERATEVAALPGYSEHETGLAVDFSFGGDWEKQERMWDWLSQNAHHHGFILRYPPGKENITGYSHEPWHYRYVGVEHAKVVYERGVVLEEYLGGMDN